MRAHDIRGRFASKEQLDAGFDCCVDQKLLGPEFGGATWDAAEHCVLITQCND